MCPNRTPRAARRSFAWLAFSAMINVAMIHADSNAAFNLAHRTEQIKNNLRGKIYQCYLGEAFDAAWGLTSFGGVTIGATTDLTNNRDLVFKDAISAVTK
jgi:hypothetical protein